MRKTPFPADRGMVANVQQSADITRFIQMTWEYRRGCPCIILLKQATVSMSWAQKDGKRWLFWLYVALPP